MLQEVGLPVREEHDAYEDAEDCRRICRRMAGQCRWAECPAPPVFRIRLHGTWVRLKISIRIRKTPESGSGSKLFLKHYKLSIKIISLFSHQKKSIERYNIVRSIKVNLFCDFGSDTLPLPTCFFLNPLLIPHLFPVFRVNAPASFCELRK